MSSVPTNFAVVDAEGNVSYEHLAVPSEDKNILFGIMGATSKEGFGTESFAEQVANIRASKGGEGSNSYAHSVRIHYVNDVYHIYGNIFEFDSFMGVGSPFIVWMHERTDADTVILHLSDCLSNVGGSSAYSIMQYVGVMGAIVSSKAKTIFSVDSLTGGLGTYFAFCCDEIDYRPEGQLAFLPTRAIKRDGYTQAVKSFVDHILKGAVSKGFITQEDVDKVCGGVTCILVSLPKENTSEDPASLTG
jgi:hypothetical protein